uniref:Uncharacterized protein n=1 Tax=Ditylenchus dipsaci TaxID=166011 RepID=A0A915DLK6_9BILA
MAVTKGRLVSNLQVSAAFIVMLITWKANYCSAGKLTNQVLAITDDMGDIKSKYEDLMTNQKCLFDYSICNKTKDLYKAVSSSDEDNLNNSGDVKKTLWSKNNHLLRQAYSAPHFACGNAREALPELIVRSGAKDALADFLANTTLESLKSLCINHMKQLKCKDLNARTRCVADVGHRVVNRYFKYVELLYNGVLASYFEK